MLIGMAQWVCMIGHLDIAFAVSSLLELFFCKPWSFWIGSLPVWLPEEVPQSVIGPQLQSSACWWDTSTVIIPSRFLEDYDGAKEEIGTGFPDPYGNELESSIFFDADHAHDHLMRRSITGIMVFVGSTPVLWRSKCQGCIATSTYTAEFVAMRSAIEEAISIRYMLRCLGVPVTKPTNLYGDNFGVIQSATIPDGKLKKKHVAISYHYVREAIAAGYINAIWVKSHENFADVCTKALGTIAFCNIIHDVMV